MTYDDDFMRLVMDVAQPNVPCKKLGFEWPPPERIYLAAGGVVREAQEGDEPYCVMVRTRMSEITDEQREGMTHVARGAEYRYESETTP